MGSGLRVECVYRVTPVGQMTMTLRPSSRALATASAVPPSPAAGRPSHTAMTTWHRPTTASPAAMKAASLGSAKSSTSIDEHWASRFSYSDWSSAENVVS